MAARPARSRAWCASTLSFPQQAPAQRFSADRKQARPRVVPPAQKAVAKLELVRQRLQRLERGAFIGEQAIEIRGMRKIDVARVDDLRLAVVDLQGAELTVAAQALIEQRLLFFNQAPPATARPFLPPSGTR
jgi:hypothetical protein